MKIAALPFILCVFLVTACSEEKKKPEESPKPKPQITTAAGVVHKTVAFQNNPDQSYALYLPKGFHPDSSYPALYFVHPQGLGAEPVLKYQGLADEYNFILAGSNVSRNGMSFDETDLAIHRLVQEVQAHYPVEDSIRLFGFSGGAKAVMHYGDKNPQVSQIIYCGSVYEFKRSSGIRLLGIAGIRDMNYADLVSFEVSLGKAPFVHHLIQTDAQHEHPSVTDMRDAFIWMKTGHVEGYDKKRVTISQEDLMREQLLKRKFYQSFSDKDLSWWKQEITFLHKEKKQDVMFERILGFIGLACYNFGKKALDNNEYEKADFIVKIYEMATPDNKDAREFRDAVNAAKAKKAENNQR